jgi:two-component system, NarL family, response regulator DegU
MNNDDPQIITRVDRELDGESKIKLMLVDDHVNFRRAFKSLFRPDEIEVVECNDGYDALKSYQEAKPDWVVMDFDMAPMDGLTATEMMIKQFPDARILLITLHDGEDIREAARKAGAVAYVRKENLIQAREIIRSNLPFRKPAS